MTAIEIWLIDGPFDGAKFLLPYHPVSIVFGFDGSRRYTYAVDGPPADLIENVVVLYCVECPSEEEVAS
jgi:hypothetical protein